MVIVYEDQLDLPERRAELYKQCVDTLLTKWPSFMLAFTSPTTHCKDAP